MKGINPIIAPTFTLADRAKLAAVMRDAAQNSSAALRHAANAIEGERDDEAFAYLDRAAAEFMKLATFEIGGKPDASA